MFNKGSKVGKNGKESVESGKKICKVVNLR
jgi:hypothetical protein